MKKLIAILMVLAIVAGFAFADDPATEKHTLTLSSTVGEHLPAFQLKYAEARTITVDAMGLITVVQDGRTILTNADKTAYELAAAHNFVDNVDPNSTAANDVTTINDDIGFDLGDGAEHQAVFTAYIVKDADQYNARTKRTFTLTFSDGAFKNLTSRGAAVADITPTIAAAGVTAFTGITSSTASGAVATVVFSGVACPEADTAVASATYTWQGNKLLDMGTYRADIVLTVVSN